MSNINDGRDNGCQISIPMVVVLLSYFSSYGRTEVSSYGRADGRTYGQSHDNQNLLDPWVTKFSKVWGSARATSARRSSSKNS